MSDDFKAHLLAPKGGDCVVCDRPRYCTMTVFYGEGVCQSCGVSYQLLMPSRTEEWLGPLGLAPADVKLPWCKEYGLLPLLRGYWRETGRALPFGCYWGQTPHYTPEDADAFWLWAHDHEAEYRDAVTGVNWEGLRELAAVARARFAGLGI